MLFRSVRNRFGKLLPPALIIQVEQAKIRLTAFAKHQAAWAEQGWRIRHIEHKVERGEGIVWELPDGKMSIHGRIDRIDENIDTKEIAVWDYKTGDTADEPRKSHVNKNGEWSDWQLPLYGLLISKLNYNDLFKVRFGYILLPKNVEGTKFISADFKPEETAAAIEKAKELAGCVLRGEFWPPSDKIRPEYDEYENILQRKVVRPWDWQLELPENKWPENKLPDNQPPENEPTETDQAEQGAEQPATENGASQGKEGKDKSDRRDRVILPRMIQVEPMIAEPGPIEEWFKPKIGRAHV